MEFKCKICGGQVQVDRTSGICICEYCGTKQTIPLFSDDSSKRLYESGNNYLQHCEYDKAENVFNQLLSINPQDAEIYWDLVMCKYGVTFVLDPRTGKYIPTCNRTHYDSVLNDKNYLNALDFSTGDKNAFYRSNGETINKIQKGIIAVAKKEKPFDIFISYKETDQNGNRTKDSIVAQELYEKLVSAGYKVFFSRITLEDKIGSEYEPYIYAALSSSKIMLTVSSSKENIEAPWVKNEWSRFLTLRQADSSKTIIPLYFSMQKSELPEEFAILSAQDISKENYEQDLIRGIKKLIPLPVLLAEKKKKTRKLVKKIGIAAICIIVVAGIISIPFMKDYIKNIGDYKAAMQLYNDKNYNEAINAFEKLDDFKNSKEMINSSQYEIAMQLYYDGNYPQAAWAFKDISNFKDSADMQKKAELDWRKDLATVITDDLDEFSNSYYIITDNGTVKGINGSADLELTIEGHGKIISIAPSSEKLYALHEDGYVSNCKENNDMPEDSEWHDIIKISRQLSYTNIALRADGTMLYGNTGPENDAFNDNWIKGISEWKDIIDFTLYYSGGLTFSDGVGAIIGIKSDGTLCAVYNDNNQYRQNNLGTNSLDIFSSNDLNQIVNQFNDIKSVSFRIDSEKQSTSPIEIIAITRSGKIQIYNQGVFRDIDADNICNISGVEILLKRNGDLIRRSDKRVILHDIVAFQSGIDCGYAITRTGNIYCCDFFYLSENFEDEWKKAEPKCAVYDEWIKKVN